MKTILASIDFSSVTPAVLTAAARLASPGQDRVVLLYVLPYPGTYVGWQIAGDMPVELLGLTREDATRRLDELARSIPEIAVETQIATGEPSNEILRRANENAADLIVMGSHGHTAFYELLVGTTAHDVLKRAECPVVIVPAGKTADVGK